MRSAAVLAAFFLAAFAQRCTAAEWPILPKDVARIPLSFAEIPDWATDDILAAAKPFRESCARILEGGKTVTGLTPPTALVSACRATSDVDWTSAERVRAFFEKRFQPTEIRPASGRGFLTGYYEPEIPGSLLRTPEFTAPLLSRPPDLVSVEREPAVTGLPPEATAARRLRDGSLGPYPDRAAILDGAVADRTEPLVWLKDDVEVFLVQVQGSTRVRLPDGTSRRFAYDGRNGWPYTSIGKKIVEEGHVPLADLNLERLKSWLRENPGEGARIMRMNRSYVFFRAAPELDDASGPVGAEGLPLTPWRSIAVDQAVWPYGLPVWLEAELPNRAGGVEPFRHLTIAQDTGSAIIGPARVDLFHGTGPEAGTRAGLLRHPVRFIALIPKDTP